jgi:hypothetical protein
LLDGLIEELYVFFEFCKVSIIFVIKKSSFFGNQHDIISESDDTRERYIIKSPSPEVAIHGPASDLR